MNKSPFASTALASCLDHLTADAALILIEDGVYAALADGAFAARLAAAPVAVYALGPDLEARGLGAAALAKGVRVVDYGGFVDLAAAHSAVVPWL